mmetsp:Transcript_74013/g.171702  ORF Transcript_74013/g.171702 Transcript_74013/m.171702 type:complete len:259 (+) Transcript_74013:443-1219(+)
MLLEHLGHLRVLAVTILQALDNLAGDFGQACLESLVLPGQACLSRGKGLLGRRHAVLPFVVASNLRFRCIRLWPFVLSRPLSCAGCRLAQPFDLLPYMLHFACLVRDNFVRSRICLVKGTDGGSSSIAKLKFDEVLGVLSFGEDIAVCSCDVGDTVCKVAQRITRALSWGLLSMILRCKQLRGLQTLRVSSNFYICAAGHTAVFTAKELLEVLRSGLERVLEVRTQCNLLRGGRISFRGPPLRHKLGSEFALLPRERL